MAAWSLLHDKFLSIPKVRHQAVLALTPSPSILHEKQVFLDLVILCDVYSHDQVTWVLFLPCFTVIKTGRQNER